MEKKNGKGKEYYNNGKLKYDGEYLDGEYKTGVKYLKNGKVEKEYLNSKSIEKQRKKTKK